MTESPTSAATTRAIALRPLAIGEILDGGFAVVRRHARVVFGMSFVLATVAAALKVAVGWAISDVPAATGLSTTSTDADGHTVFTQADLTGILASNTVSEVFGLVLAGLVALIVADAALGRAVDVRAAMSELRARWAPLTAIAIVAGGLPYAPFTMMYAGWLGIIPGLAVGCYLWTKLALAVPALMLERAGARVAITRSWRLTGGAFWRTWGARALATGAAHIGALVVAIPFALPAYLATIDHDQPSTLAATLGGVGGALVSMLTTPVIAGALTLIYIDRRMRAEALDISLRKTAFADDEMRRAADAVSLTKS